MSKKHLLILVILSLIGYGIYYAVFQSGQVPDNGSYTDLVDTSGGSGTGVQGNGDNQTMTIPVDDREIELIDVRKLGTTEDVGSGFYVLGIPADLSKQFSVTFAESDGSFAVSLNSEPVAEARTLAEEYLLLTLNISEEDLCKIPVYVGVPQQVSSYLSGQNFGLSFCPGSLDLD